MISTCTQCLRRQWGRRAFSMLSRDVAAPTHADALWWQVLASQPSKREATNFLDRYMMHPPPAPTLSVEPSPPSMARPHALLLLDAGLFDDTGELAHVADTVQALMTLGLDLVLCSLLYSRKDETVGQALQRTRTAISHLQSNLEAKSVAPGAIKSYPTWPSSRQLGVDRAPATTRSLLLTPIAFDRQQCRHEAFCEPERYVSLLGPILQSLQVSKVILLDKRGGIQHQPFGDISSMTALGMPKAARIVTACLAALPDTASAIVAPAEHSAPALVANHITEKPPAKLSTIHTSVTVFRRTAPLQRCCRVDQVDLSRLQALLEKSFKRSLEADAFWQRLRQTSARITIAGDYDGATIVTEEAPGVFYLDKFAINPRKQGSGISDTLWEAMRTDFPSLFWRSRRDNAVNNWYFERADGHLQLQYWTVFFIGMASAWTRLPLYKGAAERIPPSFQVDPLKGEPGK